MLCGISVRFQTLFHSERQVTHALLTRPPLSETRNPPKPHSAFHSVRLACVKHAASVRPEPGSNSLKILSKHLSVSQPFSELNSLIRHCWLLFRFQKFTVRLFFKSSQINFRVFLVNRCLIFKVHSAAPKVSLANSSVILSHFLPLVNSFFTFFYSFFPRCLVFRDSVLFLSWPGWRNKGEDNGIYFKPA